MRFITQILSSRQIHRASGHVVWQWIPPSPIGCRLTEVRQIELVRNWAKVKTLILSGVPVHDSDVSILLEMPQLEILSLEGSNVTDLGLTVIAGLPALQIVNVIGTCVTERAAATFRKHHPNCLVAWAPADLTDTTDYPWSTAGRLKLEGQSALVS